ncbi:Ig-like domain-containing protein [Luteococcus sp. Sow4_B9]|uniref:L,D-transpeptidase n=1 Tax=Luteococcus sp. Sow4_B9 TaxID=3438792 RepID=UPI003F9A4DA9
MDRKTAAATLAAALLATGCAASGEGAGEPAGSSTTGSSQSAASAKASTSPAADPSSSATSASTDPSLAINVQDGANDVPVSTLITVTPTAATVTDVTITTTASGKNAVTKLTAQANDKGIWIADNRLDPSASYTVTATATGDDGKEVTKTSSFRTAALSRQQEVFPTLAPVINGPYGVAQPVVVQFDLPVQNKAEFERNMHVTSVPAQEGSWGWLDDKTVHWRPKQHWKPGSTVKLDARLNGVDAGDGRYGQLNRELELKIGKNQQGKVDIAKHTITWLRDGKPVGTWPMTAGKPGFVTRSGTKVVMEKAENITMNSETTGIAQDSAEGYEVKAAFALRVTKSGEFIHSAPWNEGNFGVRNASHGCVGMRDDEMYKLYTTAQIGDPVVFTGSDRKLEFGNGWSEWDISWEQWKAKSALR